MFAAIKTNGASHIVIHIPHEGSDKSLPALARLLEQNATFINAGYMDVTLAKPDMSISLSNVFTHENCDVEIAIKDSTAVLGDEFVNATPEVLTSNAKAVKRAKEENDRLSTEVRFLKSQLEQTTAQIKALTELSENA